jgi:ketosteroid isomerase-like protein
MRYTIVIILALASFSHPAYGQRQTSTQNKTSQSDANALAVQKASEDFIAAFNNLEWEKFSRSFSDDATVFFPFSQVPRRAGGRTEVEFVFKSFFDEMRKRKSGPPYQNITPKDVDIRMLKDAAIVTFHLGEDNPLGRRTVVFQKQKGEWLIVHLHASIISKPK